MNREVIEQARPYDGTPPEEWELLGMRQNPHCRFRYYRDKNGNISYTIQRMKRDNMRIALHEEEGITYAKKVYMGPRRSCRRA